MAAESTPHEENCTCGNLAACRSTAGLKPFAPQSGRAQPGISKTADPKLIGPLKRWILWFLTFFGIYASSSMCPFCGTPGCPVGAGSAALVGGFFAALWQYGKGIWEYCWRIAARRRS